MRGRGEGRAAACAGILDKGGTRVGTWNLTLDSPSPFPKPVSEKIYPLHAVSRMEKQVVISVTVLLLPGSDVRFHAQQVPVTLRGGAVVVLPLLHLLPIAGLVVEPGHAIGSGAQVWLR